MEILILGSLFILFLVFEIASIKIMSQIFVEDNYKPKYTNKTPKSTTGTQKNN